MTINHTINTPIAYMRPECLASQPCKLLEFDSLNLPNITPLTVVEISFIITTKISKVD